MAHVLGLSTRSAEALVLARLRLAERIETEPATALADFAATLAHGRERFPYRCAVVGDDPAVLAELLRSGEGEGFFTDGATGTVSSAEHRAAQLWCRGEEVDLMLGRPGRRVRLPGHPFRRGAATPAESGAGTRPLTPFEQRRLFHDLVRAGSSAEHNVTATAELGGPLDPEALQSAFTTLQQRHPALRTVFEEYGGRWRARVLPDASVGLSAVGCSAPFTLAGTPLVRCEVIEEPVPTVALTLYEPMAEAVPVPLLLAELLDRLPTPALS